MSLINSEFQGLMQRLVELCSVVLEKAKNVLRIWQQSELK